MHENTPVPTDSHPPTAAAKADSHPPTPAQTADQSVIIIRDFQPGQLVRVVFLTVEQAKQLPQIPTDALQIAVGLQLTATTN